MSSEQPSRPTLLVFADSLAYYGPTGGLPADDPRIWPNIVAAQLGWDLELIGRIGWTCRDVWWAATQDPRAWAALPRAGAVIFATGGMDSLPSPLPTALRELIRYVRPPWLRRWVRDGYGWVQPRLSPVARAALPPHLSAEYLEQTRGAIDFNRPGIPIVASLPSVHIAETYGKAHHGRAGTVAAITQWADEHDVPLVDLKAAVAEQVMSGRGNPDGIHWNFEAHQAVAELMLKALAEAGVSSRETARLSSCPSSSSPIRRRAFPRSCVGSGRYVKSRCTFCSTTPTCATAWTRFRTTSTSTDTPPPPRRHRPSWPMCIGRRWPTAAATGWWPCTFRRRCREPFGAAETTAAEIGSAVRVLDSKSAAMNTGFIALAAARAAAGGADLDTVAQAAAAAVTPQPRVHRRAPAGQPAPQRAHRRCRRVAGHQAVAQAAAAHRRRQTRSGATGSHRQQSGRDDDRPGVRGRRRAVSLDRGASRRQPRRRGRPGRRVGRAVAGV